MALWTQLKNAVSSLIKPNGNEEITGQVDQNVLLNIIDNLGEYGTYVELAALDTSPGSPDGPVFYIASESGVYPNFGALEVGETETAIIKWNGTTWEKDSLPFQKAFEAVNIDIGYGERFINSSGDLATNVSYTTREYDVVEGQEFRISGNNRGSDAVACYALYSGAISSANLVDIVLISDRQNPVNSGVAITLDEYITIPAGVTKIGLVSVSAENPQLLLYYSIDYVNELDKRIKENQNKINLTIQNQQQESINIANDLSDSYINYSGSISNSASYITRVYDVKSGGGYIVSGQVRGTASVACYAIYSGDVSAGNLLAISKNEDYVYPKPVSSFTVQVNDFVIIPDGGVKIALVSTVGEDPQMILTHASIEDYSKRELKYLDTLGDSLTMGSTNFGYYQDSLKALLNINNYNYNVRNWGVGGEKTQTILSRLGAFTILFPNEFILPLNGNEVEVANGTTANYLRNTYNNEIVSPLLQGAGNDPLQREAVVNPCYVNGIECTLTRYIESGSGTSADDVSYTLKRNEVGDRDITFPVNQPLLMNTGFSMGGSSVSILWMGTNGTYSDFNDLLEQHKQAVKALSNNQFIVIGLHLLTQANGDIYEGLMKKEFGNKFFNLREYTATNMIYDAGITPTAQDLTDMSNGLCPASLLFDSTHFLPESNAIIGERLYDLCYTLGYL